MTRKYLKEPSEYNNERSTTYISFYNKSGTIRAFRQTVRAIGEPRFIRFQLHKERHLMLLEPFDRISFTSFRVPININKDNGKLDIKSKSFTRLISEAMEWDVERSYRIPGEVNEEQKHVIFDLSRAEIITEDIRRKNCKAILHSCRLPALRAAAALTASQKCPCKHIASWYNEKKKIFSKNKKSLSPD